MRKNIILAGVGGQGILTIAAIIDHAAMQKGYFIKQAEVHGMSQRGGAVQSHLRISDTEIHSDLIPLGEADLILSLEPMEALRYLPYLAPGGTVITAIGPVKNISNYPDEVEVLDTLKKTVGQHYLVDAETLAKEAGDVRTVNVVLTGAALPYLGIDKNILENAIRDMFSTKGEKIVDINLKAFNLGAGISKK